MWGHALLEDPGNVARAIACLEEFDRQLARIIAQMPTGSLLLIAADHGMKYIDDYGHHSKEDVPLLAWFNGCGLDPGKLFDQTCPGLTKIGMMVAKYFGDRCAEQFSGCIVEY